MMSFADYDSSNRAFPFNHILILDEESYRRIGCNPFVLVRMGLFTKANDVPSQLPPLTVEVVPTSSGMVANPNLKNDETEWLLTAALRKVRTYIFVLDRQDALAETVLLSLSLAERSRFRFATCLGSPAEKSKKMFLQYPIPDVPAEVFAEFEVKWCLVPLSETTDLEKLKGWKNGPEEILIDLRFAEARVDGLREDQIHPYARLFAKAQASGLTELLLEKVNSLALDGGFDQAVKIVADWWEFRDECGAATVETFENVVATWKILAWRQPWFENELTSSWKRLSFGATERVALNRLLGWLNDCGAGERALPVRQILLLLLEALREHVAKPEGLPFLLLESIRLRKPSDGDIQTICDQILPACMQRVISLKTWPEPEVRELIGWSDLKAPGLWSPPARALFLQMAAQFAELPRCRARMVVQTLKSHTLDTAGRKNDQVQLWRTIGEHLQTRLDIEFWFERMVEAYPGAEAGLVGGNVLALLSHHAGKNADLSIVLLRILRRAGRPGSLPNPLLLEILERCLGQFVRADSPASQTDLAELLDWLKEFGGGWSRPNPALPCCSPPRSRSPNSFH
jgi:hypothetical protein